MAPPEASASSPPDAGPPAAPPSEGTILASTDDISGASGARPRRPNRLWHVCIFILVVELCERLCYYTIQGSQRNFLEAAGPSRTGKARGMPASVAISISACWSMLSYLSCVAGGYIADNRLGRYRTILYFALVYVFGVSLVAVSAYPLVLASDASLPIYLAGALIFVAVGTGAIKPNVMNFGADQYDTTDVVEREQQRSFFSYFYLTINIGVIGANGYTSNLATSDSTSSDPGAGYFKSYLIAAVAMCLAFLAFLAGTPRYAARGGVVRTRVLSVLRMHLVVAAKSNWRARLGVLGWCLTPASMAIVLVGSLAGEENQAMSAIATWSGMGLALLGCALLVAGHQRNDYIAPLADRDEALVEPVGAVPVTVDDVRGAFACMPTIVCVNLGFNILYNAMNNAYPVQACQMDTRIFGHQLNGSFFGLGDAFAIIVFVPLLEIFAYPALQRLRGGRPVTRWAKYTAGFLFGMMANLSAAYIEFVRRGMSVGDRPHFVPCPPGDLGTSACSGPYLLSQCSPNASLPMTELSAFWTFVPMALTGIGEILVNPVIYQFVFDEAPQRLRSVVQALNLVVAGAVSNAVTAGLGPLVPENLNSGQLDYFYFANVVLAAAWLVAYWCVAEREEVSDVAAEGSLPPRVLASLLSSEHRGASLLGSASQLGSFLPVRRGEGDAAAGAAA